MLLFSVLGESLRLESLGSGTMHGWASCSVVQLAAGYAAPVHWDYGAHALSLHWTLWNSKSVSLVLGWDMKPGPRMLGCMGYYQDAGVWVSWWRPGVHRVDSLELSVLRRRASFLVMPDRQTLGNVP
eukprot:TRINITY_DN6902_c0_g1_i5.p3 TRINITY_DN6902_c0_g1~~TRINITY_DN6902_c0_g1_i5.p3  ORF type:complete len:127 (-),score=3.87 TRINITY_DN6902_c0_g1_i5:48-428(-)